jgi:hypothetical protein
MNGRQTRFWILILAHTAFTWACGGGGTNTTPPTNDTSTILYGGSGQPCIDGFSCNAGLACINGICTSATVTDNGTTPPAGAQINLMGYRLLQTDSTQEFFFPDGIVISPGDIILVVRGTTKQEFETRWQTTLSPNVWYVNSEDLCPKINGDETYELYDGLGTLIDGPTPVLIKHGNMQRISQTPVFDPSAWAVYSDDLGFPTPGIVNIPITGAPGLYISEISDSAGQEMHLFEFVEIFYKAD